MTLKISEETLWAKIGKQAVELEMLRNELLALTQRCAELEKQAKADEKDG